tara:strand:+ start:2669 stop:4531 length:1863 start_codon:yes stop_codon:yes gene_type:complete
MPRLADGFINELKERIDLYDLISSYVELKKSGSSWVGLSPFQQEKTPSFYVHPDKGFFKCFSSGETGDAISFVQKMENLDFHESLEFLSQRFNIPLKYEKGNSSQPYVKSIRSDLHSIHEVARDWFMSQLVLNNDESKVALQYWLNDRNFDSQTAKEFGIGYSPTDRFALGKFMRKQNFSIDLLSKSGLFRENLQSGLLVSSFCGRLMIPIHEKLGRICGFTARKLSVTPEWGEKKSPKYINSPETVIFQKGELLFNLHLANKAIKEKKDFLLVEGQLDAIRCYIEGFHTVIAPQGTAFKDSQAQLLRKSNPRRVICLLDGDEAGRKAGLKYVPIFLEAGLDACFAILPSGTDPDQILVEKGKKCLQEILEKGISMIDYVVQNLSAKDNLKTPSVKKDICEFIFKSLIQVKSFVIRESYLEEIANSLAISMESVKTDFLSFERRKRPNSKSSYSSRSNNKSPENGLERLTNVEDDLLFLLLHDNRIAGPLAYLIEPTWLNLESVTGCILAKVFAEIKADGPITASRIEDLLETDEERKIFQLHLFQEYPPQEKENFLQLANECLSVLFLRSSKKLEERILTRLKDSDDVSSSSSKIRSELKELRKLRNSPPSLSLSVSAN